MISIRQNRRNNKRNNRINFLMAIVFLFAIMIVFRLYDLQIVKHELYSAKADDQHQIYNELEPERGEIFITEKGGEDLYPFASNKDFALIYAIPLEMENEEEKAEKIFLVFDKEKVAKEVDKYFEEKDKEELAFSFSLIALLPAEEKAIEEAKIKRNFDLLRADKTWLEGRDKKKEEEIEKRKGDFIKNYIKILKKRSDPYEPLKEKVSEEKLKEFYALLLSDKYSVISPESLILKDGIIYKKIGAIEEAVNIKGISQIMKKYRYYPENNIGSHILGFVNRIDNREQGNYGLEGFFNNEFSGQYGSIKSARGANREIIIVNDREYVKPKNGVSMILSIDRSIQFFACGKLAEAGEKHEAEGASVLAVNPKTGEIIAMCSWPDFDPNNYNQVEEMEVFNNPIIFDQYEPGSVFKAITMAAAIDMEKVSPSTLYNDKGSLMIEGWPKPIRNSDFETHGPHGMVDMNYVLMYSLNTGAIFAMEQIGAKNFTEYVKNFGFGEKTGIEMETENIGNISNLTRETIRPINAATASFGQGITVTPLQMTMSYAAIANGGILMKPFIVKEIINEDGTREKTKPVQIRRVVSERAANLVNGILINVINKGHNSKSKASVPGYYIGGKTGTAQVANTDNTGYSKDETIHTFIGIAPADNPRFVMLVKIDKPKDAKFADSSAAPLFKEIAEFMLKYYEIPKEK